MKKVASALGTLGMVVLPFLAPVLLLADEDINVKSPGIGIEPSTNFGVILGNLLAIIMIAGALFVLIMLVIGAFQWITAGGEKDATSKARDRITNALIGLVILALAFVIARVISSIVHIDLQNFTLPSLDRVNPLPRTK